MAKKALRMRKQKPSTLNFHILLEKVVLVFVKAKKDVYIYHSRWISCHHRGYDLCENVRMPFKVREGSSGVNKNEMYQLTEATHFWDFSGHCAHKYNFAIRKNWPSGCIHHHILQVRTTQSRRPFLWSHGEGLLCKFIYIKRTGKIHPSRRL